MLIAKLGAFGRKAHVAGQHQFDPAGQTQPLHCDYDREGGGFERTQVFHAKGDEMVQRGGIVQFTFHFHQIGTGAKVLALRPDEDRPNSGVRLEFRTRDRNTLMHLK